MNKIFVIISASLFTFCTSNKQSEKATEQEQNAALINQQLPDCEWCGAMDAPERLDWQTTITEDEPGENLVLSGVVYKADGVSPAAGIIIYAYHTNAEGIYPKRGNETGNGRRHGYLRGWVKTNGQGRYKFNTIRPAPYPSHVEPAHVHLTVSSTTIKEYWLNATWFEGDPLITQELKGKLTRLSGQSNIIKLSKDDSGIWRGTRDIILDQ